MAPSENYQSCDYTILWATDGVVNIEYPVMLPIGEVMGYAEGMETRCIHNL